VIVVHARIIAIGEYVLTNSTPMILSLYHITKLGQSNTIPSFQVGLPIPLFCLLAIVFSVLDCSVYVMPAPFGVGLVFITLCRFPTLFALRLIPSAGRLASKKLCCWFSLPTLMAKLSRQFLFLRSTFAYTFRIQSFGFGRTILVANVF
jgi:hypothetical protein